MTTNYPQPRKPFPDWLTTLLSWLLLIGITGIIIKNCTGCTKQPLPPAEDCMAVTYLYQQTGDTIIHWHRVCGQELNQYLVQPRQQMFCDDGRIIQLIIGADQCKKQWK